MILSLENSKALCNRVQSANIVSCRKIFFDVAVTIGLPINPPLGSLPRKCLSYLLLFNCWNRFIHLFIYFIVLVSHPCTERIRLKFSLKRILNISFSKIQNLKKLRNRLSFRSRAWVRKCKKKKKMGSKKSWTSLEGIKLVEKLGRNLGMAVLGWNEINVRSCRSENA